MDIKLPKRGSALLEFDGTTHEVRLTIGQIERYEIKYNKSIYDFASMRVRPLGESFALVILAIEGGGKTYDQAVDIAEAMHEDNPNNIMMGAVEAVVAATTPDAYLLAVEDSQKKKAQKKTKTR